MFRTGGAWRIGGGVVDAYGGRMQNSAEGDATDERTAVILAGHRGDVATARAALSSADAGVRAAALSALARIGVLSADELVVGLGDADRVVAARAADLSAKEAADEKVDCSLLVLLASDDTDLAEVAAWALGERHQRDDADTDEIPEAHGPAHIVAALVGVATDHGDALVRESAVAALGCIGDDSSLSAILRACDDKATVRRRAIIALASFEGPDVDAALARALGDRDWQVRQAAEDLTSETSTST